MKSLRTILILLISTIIIFTVLVNDVPNKNDVTGSIKKKPLTKVDWWVNNSKLWFGVKWTDKEALKEVSDITGVAPDITTPNPHNNSEIDLMIATDNLPDLMTFEMDDPNINLLIKSGLVYPYDELIKKYSPGFKNEISPEIWKDLSYNDGSLYVLPGFFIPRDEYDKKKNIGNVTYNVRKDIYEQLGSPDMSSPESFTAALRLFKSQYPLINGDSSIPVSLFGFEDNQINIIERSFGIKDFYETDKGKVVIKYKDPNYLNMIYFLNDLYREGLMDKFAFIKQHEQIQKDLTSGRIFAAPMNYESLSNINTALDKVKPGSHFIAVEPLQAAKDVAFPGQNRLGSVMTMVSKNSKTAAKVISFLRYLWSPEGCLLVNFGQEGKDYTVKANTIHLAGLSNEKGGYINYGFPESLGTDAFSLLYYPYYFTRQDNCSQDYADSAAMADKYACDNSINILNMQPDYSMPEWKINQDVTDIVRKELPEAIMAKSKESAYAYYQSMMFQLNKVGLKKLEAYWNDMREKNENKLID